MSAQTQMGEYPTHLEETARLRDGREVFIRPILPSDAVLMKKAVERADEETLYYRFFTAHPNLDDKKLEYLAGVDYVWRLALIAFGPSGPVGIARYEGAVGQADAEFAVVVDPAWRHVGIATLLGEMLAEAAVKQGIRRFVAHYLAENAAAEGMLHGLGFAAGDLEAGVMTSYLGLS